MAVSGRRRGLVEFAVTEMEPAVTGGSRWWRGYCCPGGRKYEDWIGNLSPRRREERLTKSYGRAVARNGGEKDLGHKRGRAWTSQDRVRNQH